MKITDNCTNIEKTFEELQVGNVFRDEDGEIMMKIDPYGNDKTNCVSLESGEGFKYYGDEKVTFITDVELIIR